MVRFDKPCCRFHGAMRYFAEHMAKQDYLTEQGQVEMTWEGKGAERLGLRGHVHEDHFASLCAGRDPFTDKKLTPRDNGRGRRVCYFGQISAPKDVSIAHLVGGDQRIAVWWDDSVKETLKEIEAVTATRVRLGGVVEDRATGNMVAAVVTHDTSRALDPQLHTHVCVMNVTHDPVEYRWKAVEPRGFYKYQSYLREVSYNKLAEKMKEGGYEIEKARSGGFNIQGFPDDLRKSFSKRREEIERVADVLKTRNQDVLQSIAMRTRASKQHHKTDVLKAQWLSEAEATLPEIQRIIASSSPRGESPKSPPAGFLHLAEDHVFERQSAVDERVLLREALIAGRGEIKLEEVRATLAARLRSGGLIQSERMIVSRETLKMEKSVVDWSEGSKGSLSSMGRFAPDTSLSVEQSHAAKNILNSRDRVTVLIGDAGTGKSTTLAAIVQGIQRVGNLAFACAPSSGAAQELHDKLGVKTDTVQQLLVNDKLKEQITGRTIIVDEAGLLSVNQMQALCQLAERQNCRLLLVGDVKQHHSVEAGDALRSLQKYANVETVRLQEIHRQKDQAYRKVVGLLASGKPHAAFTQLDILGGIREEKNWSKLLDQAASTYVEKLQAGQSCLAISPVWSEVNNFTTVLRERLKQEGALGTEDRTYKAVQSLQWTRSLKTQASNYQVGDVLTFQRDGAGLSKHEMATVVGKDDNHLILERSDRCRVNFDPKRHSHFDVGLPRVLSIAPGEKLLVRSNFLLGKLKNGDLVTVEHVKDDGELVLRDGRTIPAHFRQFTHGYATTSHAAQGKTVDHGLLILGEKGFQAANLKQAYVSNSRFRQSQTVFTVDKEAALGAMGREAERSLAVEAIQADESLVKAVAVKIKPAKLDWSPAMGSQSVNL